MASYYPSSWCTGATTTATKSKLTSKEMEEDLWRVDPDPGSSSDSDSESDSEMDAVKKRKPQPKQKNKQPIRTGLKIVIPARPHGSSVVAARNVSDEPARYGQSEDDENENENEDYEMDYEAEDEEMDCEGDEEPGELPVTSPSTLRKAQKGARSPLSSSSESGEIPIYARFPCRMDDCVFVASSAQHLRHHISTFSHGRLRSSTQHAV